MMAKVRVLVVEDSVTVRRHLCDVVAADPGLELVGEASDGKSAIELCQARRPDVVTMDMMLPVMTGLGATEYIMAHCPTPILVVSSSTNRGELFKTYEALAAGAVDVLEKPAGGEPDGHWEARFVAAIKLTSRIRVITHLRARLSFSPRSHSSPSPSSSSSPSATAPRTQLVAIGASTGGPAAIIEVLRALPASFPLPILFVLHINEPFGTAFADWLDGQTGLRVAYARDGQAIGDAGGRVMMAPPDHHLSVQSGRLHLSRQAERHSCRPSVDVLFESVAREYGAAAAACLMTGMGRDGAAGLLAIREAGGVTIAQDEATSVVYGMPREAVLLGAVARSLPLQEIGPALAVLAGQAAYPGQAPGGREERSR
jgi:two-component system, chemotaxis family, protein-glutamate methylesterase/glutaminase